MLIQTKLEKQLDEQFGDHGNFIKDSMAEMLHQLGLDIGISKAVDVEHQKGTQKGIEFEEYCEEIISEIAKHHNDRLESTGTTTGLIEGSKKGDHVYTIKDSGKKIVLEMKDYTSPQSTPKLERYMNEAIENRGAEYGIVISKRKNGFSKDVGIFQEYGNKLFVALTTEESENVELQNELLVIALRWARLRLKQKSGTVDSSLIIEKIENVQRNMKKFSSIKAKCTNIKGISDEISEDLEELRETINADLLGVSKSLT
jgi:predicted transcriptional regulator with HTH domain